MEKNIENPPLTPEVPFAFEDRLLDRAILS